MKTLDIGGIMMEMTPERIRGTEEAIVETQRQINREMSYREDLRKHDNIAQWEAHIVMLQNMLEGA